MRKILFAVLACALAAHAVARPADYAKAVAIEGRSDDFVKLDAGRHPAEILDFMGLKRGMHVLDLLAGEGYYSQIMGRYVGPKGSVTAFEPTQFSDEKSAAKWEALSKAQPNVRFESSLWQDVKFPPNSFDFTMIHLNYHDFYWSSDKYHLPATNPDTVLAMLFRATKPGGIVAVIDHVGDRGDTRAIVDKLHRIDPAIAKADFIRAGFTFEGESPLLHVAADDHTKLVFDPTVRGQTDRFVYRFRKPR